MCQNCAVIFLKMRVRIETLGCKMNFVESERLAEKLTKMGFEITDKNFEYSIVNTCTVTSIADKKSRGKINNLAKKSKVIITGCAPKVDKADWQKKYPNTIVCKNEKEILNFFGKIETQKAKNIFNPSRTRVYVEIQNGCDNYCSYCIIPFARGKSKNRKLAEIITEIQNLEKQGYKEIVLTGINLASWGAGSTRKPQENKFASLLQEILDKTKMLRIRVSSVGPEYLNDDFFEVFKNERICDHLHISMQSGSPEILKKMNRGHNLEKIYEVCKKAKEVRKNVAITTDIIVGFPSETEKDFQKSIELVQNLKLAKVHVFPYSIRKGTVAAKMPQVDEKIKKQRAEKLRKIADKLRKDFIKKNIGKTLEVLFEHDETGLTTNYIRVKNIGTKENEIEKIRLTKENTILMEPSQ